MEFKLFCVIIFFVLCAFPRVKCDTESTTSKQIETTSQSDPGLTQKNTNNTKTHFLSSLPLPIRNIIEKIRESENIFGHVEVREGAFMFWWLYYADGTKEKAHTKPLIIWIQGGPSVPGSGLGNFVEIGPLTMTLKKRPLTWVKGKNVLFVDSPVGSGFSYVKEDSLYCKTDKDVASDLIYLVKELLNKFPEFKETPVHVFSQSYGAKIASYFAYYMYKEIEKRNVEMNLKTVGLGSGWVDTKATSAQVADFLFQTGLIDKIEFLQMRSRFQNLTGMIDRKEYIEAFKYRLDVYGTQINYNSYNIFQTASSSVIKQLTGGMNGLISLYFGPEFRKPYWNFLNADVIGALSSDFMKPANNVVEKILNETNIRVVVYNGDLDSVTPIAGAVNWVHDLNWAGKEKFYNAKRHNLHGLMNGYFKEHEKLSLWWILKAGHWIPTDNPEAMEQILQYIVHEKHDLFAEPSESSENKTSTIIKKT